MIEFIKKEKYQFEDFLQIISILRSPEGCPWDREQSHKSLRSCMMEEAAELLASIRIYEDTNNYENMQEELGDILLQVVMHSQIAKEEELFSIEDVIDEISKKMIRRHPHVFGMVEVENSDEVLRNWDEIKKVEKEKQKWTKDPLHDIPLELPSLVRASKVIKKIKENYQEQPYYSIKTPDEIGNLLKNEILKINEILLENNKSNQQVDLSNGLGNLLMLTAEIASNYKIPIEQILNDKIGGVIEQLEPTN